MERKKGYWTPEKKKEALDFILEKLAEGASLNSLFRDYEDKLPSKISFLVDWLREPEMVNQYQRIMGYRETFLFEEMMEISNAENPFVHLDKNTGAQAAFEKQRDTQIKTRMWVLSRMNPKKYGDKVDVDMQDNPTTKAFKDLTIALNERLKKEENKEEEL